MLLLLTAIGYTACNSKNAQREQEVKDSLAAEAAADSMLEAATADTLAGERNEQDTVRH